jgi:LmbE family N-acetylglucosaminyl deacetylase
VSWSSISRFARAFPVPRGTKTRVDRYVFVSRDNICISETELLSRITAPERPVIHLKTLVIVAHPDDETLGCGALLPRLSDVTVLHVTDGAPRDSIDARRSGFTHWADYARARRREVERAANIAGLPAQSLKSLGIPDQSAALRLAQLTRAMLGFIAGVDLVLTQAFEGGHPDHDATAFAVGSARARMRGKAPIVLEMPFYRQSENGQEWMRPTLDATVHAARLVLTAQERSRKAEMLAAYETQRDALAEFGVRDEVYRVAPEYDFTQPLDGALYDSYPRGVTGGQFAELARAARGELGLDGLRR